MSDTKVIFTGAIPQYPFCKKPTKRSGGIACLHDSRNSGDRFRRAVEYTCWDCIRSFKVVENDVDGFEYVL